MINATQIRKGMIILLNDKLYRVEGMKHITPGKGNAVIQTKIRDLNDMTIRDYRFRSAEKVEKVALETKEVSFSYKDGEQFIFMDNESENPILRIEYPSEEVFLKVYKRDEFVYESAVKLINLGVITPSKIKTLMKNGSKNKEKLFLILKYKTNYKTPILKNYSFTYKLAEMLGLSMSYEEVDDGFILFYQSQEDFEVGRIDLTKFKEVKRQLEDKGAWQEDYKDLWNR